MKMKGRQIQYITYMRPPMLAALRKLSKKTKVPIAAYIRMGIEYVLKKAGVTWKSH